jgi:hypothetical protein
MGITIEQVEERKAQLIQQRDQLAANINACNGAVENCDWIIAILKTEEREATSQKNDEGSDCQNESDLTPRLSGGEM